VLEATTPQLTTAHQTVRRSRIVFWDLLSFVLRDFVRSPWVFFNLLALVAIHALFYKYSPGRSYFFGIEYASTMLLVAITTGVLFGRANRAESYAILARPVPHASYTGAIMLAAWVIAVAGHLLTTLVMFRFGTWQNPQSDQINAFTLLLDWRGNLPVLAGAAFAVGLIGLLSTFVSPSGVRLGVLALLALLVMSFDNRNVPITSLRPVLQELPPVLAPVAGALKYASDLPPDSVATTSLVFLGGYTLLLIIVVLLLSSSRELVLD
jgi:hypothetical protein